MAARLIQERDELVASGKRPHRVTEFFAGFAENSLRADLDHAAGRGMSERLRCEVRSYQLCKVDDTWAEAAHRDVSCFGQRATAAKIPYIAASQRLGQTLASVDKMSQAELRQFHECMRKRKAIGQLSPGPAKVLRPARMKPRALASRVYRFDAAALRDWGAEVGGALALLDDRPAKRRSIATRLQIDYLASAIADGELLSLPLVTEEVLARAQHTALVDMPALFHQEQDSKDSFFTIVDKGAGRKKQLRTAAQSQDAMARPVSLQRMAWWPAGVEREGERLVYHDGYPQIVDLLQLAPWLVMRGGLRRWRTAESGVVGCLALSEPEVVSAPTDWRLEETPALCLLESLALAGWMRGPPPLQHTVVSAKQFQVKDPIASRAYLRCLLGLDGLLGKMPFLRSDQPATYYSCVLASEQPRIIPCDRSPAEYKQLLASSLDESRLALLDDDRVDVAGPASPTSSDEVVVTVSTRATRGNPCVANLRRARGRGAKQEDWGSLVWSAAPAPQAKPALQDARNAATQQCEQAALEGPVSNSGAASSSDQAPPAAEPAGPAVELAALPLGDSNPTRKRSILEGSEVVEEAHGVFGQPGSYRRLIVSCAHHGTKKGSCRKTRSFGVRSSAQDLGDLEPYAFLGLWLREHAEFADSAAHKKYAPTAAQVRAYASEKAWLPAAV